MNPAFNKFSRIITNPIAFRFFLFTKLPAAFFAGLRIHYFDDLKCVVRIRYSWFSQNPFHSIYFAVEAMAAEMSAGMLAFGQVYQRDPAVSMLVEKVEASFTKKATGVILFTCEDGLAFQAAVEEALGRKLARVDASHVAPRAAHDRLAHRNIEKSFGLSPNVTQSCGPKPARAAIFARVSPLLTPTAEISKIDSEEFECVIVASSPTSR